MIALLAAALRRRISSGEYIEPRHFLADASDMVIERVRDAIEKHDSVKVNTVFNGEFVNIRGERDNKNITTKNIEFYRASNVREWYEQRVIDVTLAMLDEFAGAVGIRDGLNTAYRNLRPSIEHGNARGIH